MGSLDVLSGAIAAIQCVIERVGASRPGALVVLCAVSYGDVWNQRKA
jgi:hypothetical protein